MEDRIEEILTQYTFEVYGRTRVRGGNLLDTSEGYKIINETRTSAGRLVWEHKVKTHLKESGFVNIDSFCLNKEGNISSIGQGGIRYVIRDWYVGEECNIRNIDEIKKASVNLAVLHTYLRNIEPYEGSVCAVAQDILASFEKHNTELGHIRNFLRNRKEKNDYELALVQAFPDYYRIAVNVLECLKVSRFGELMTEACRNNRVMHGSYTYHNIIMCGDSIATTVFDRCTYGLQLMDLYYFLRKVMEKNEWNIMYGEAVLEGYESICPLPEDERVVLALLLLYPEKFWKLASYYMNSKKTWISGKNMEKLKALCIQRENRENFIRTELLKESSLFDIISK